MSTYKILLVDDHSLVRDGIKSLLEGESDLKVVGEASNGEEAIQYTGELSPNLVICDIRMPKKTGIEAVSEMTKLYPDTRYIMLSMHDSEEYILQSVQAGAHGYLLKDAGKEEFLKAMVNFKADVSKQIETVKADFDVKLSEVVKENETLKGQVLELSKEPAKPTKKATEQKISLNNLTTRGRINKFLKDK